MCGGVPSARLMRVDKKEEADYPWVAMWAGWGGRMWMEMGVSF